MNNDINIAKYRFVPSVQRVGSTVTPPVRQARSTLVPPADPQQVIVKPAAKGRLHIIINMGRSEKVWVVSAITLIFLLNLLGASIFYLFGDPPRITNPPGSRGYEVCPQEQPCWFDKSPTSQTKGGVQP